MLVQAFETVGHMIKETQLRRQIRLRWCMLARSDTVDVKCMRQLVMRLEILGK